MIKEKIDNKWMQVDDYKPLLRLDWKDEVVELKVNEIKRRV